MNEKKKKLVDELNEATDDFHRAIEWEDSGGGGDFGIDLDIADEMSEEELEEGIKRTKYAAMYERFSRKTGYGVES